MGTLRCVALRGAAWRCVALRGAAWRCVALRGAAWRCVALRGASLDFIQTIAGPLGRNIYGIYMTFLNTLLEHPREYIIFVVVALGIENIFGFELMLTQS